MHEVLSEEVYTTRLKEVVSWAKTSLATLEIDDEQITEQICKAAQLRARVLQDEAEVKNSMEVLEASKRNEIRKNKFMAGEKITEKALEDLVLMDEDIQKMGETLRTMQYRVNIIEGLFMSISVSKRMFIERNKQKINHIYRGEE